jgi:hypothetical protein
LHGVALTSAVIAVGVAILDAVLLRHIGADSDLGRATDPQAMTACPELDGDPT